MKHRGVDILAAGERPPEYVIKRFRKVAPIEAIQVTSLTPIDQGALGWDLAWPGDWIVLDHDCPYRIPPERFAALYEEIVSE